MMVNKLKNKFSFSYKYIFYLSGILLILSSDLRNLIFADEIDTAMQRILKIQDDTLRINEINNYTWKIKSSNPYQATVLAEENLKSAKSIKYNFGQSSILNTLGAINLLQGNYEVAMKYYQNALKINSEIYNLDGISRNLNNIAIIHNRQKDFDKALEYNLKALDINLKLKNNELIANSYNNVGNVYSNKSNDNKSLEFHNKALEINRKINDKEGIARNLGNIGLVFKKLGNIVEAKKYLQEAILINQELNDDFGLAISLINLADCFKTEHNFSSSLSLLSTAEKLSKNLGAKQLIMDTYEGYYETYEKKFDFKSAFDYQRKYLKISDSVFNEEKALEIGKLEGRYELELQLEKKRQLEKDKLEKEEIEKNRVNNLQFSAIFIFILIIFSSVFVVGKFVASDKTIEAIIFLSFLILFEFLLVLLDPIMDNYTNGLPLISLLFNIGLALLIFPLHAYFETKLKKIVTENKKKKILEN